MKEAKWRGRRFRQLARQQESTVLPILWFRYILAMDHSEEMHLAVLDRWRGVQDNWGRWPWKKGLRHLEQKWRKLGGGRHSIFVNWNRKYFDRFKVWPWSCMNLSLRCRIQKDEGLGVQPWLRNKPWVPPTHSRSFFKEALVLKKVKKFFCVCVMQIISPKCVFWSTKIFLN